MPDGRKKLATLHIIQNAAELHFLAREAKDRERFRLVIFLDPYTGLRSADDFTPPPGVHVVRPSSPWAAPTWIPEWVSKVVAALRLRRWARTYFYRRRSELVVDRVEIGINGSLQMAIISGVRCVEPTCFVRMTITTTLVRPVQTVTGRARGWVASIFRALNIEFLGPSLFGVSKAVDEVVVNSQSAREVLVQKGASPDRISLVPELRVRPFQEALERGVRKVSGRVLFVASAWAWHGRHDIEDWQDAAIERFIQFAEEHGLEHWQVRLHPNQIQERRSWTAKLTERVSRIQDYHEDLLSSEVVVSYRSTALEDALAMGIDCFVYAEGAPEVGTNEAIDRVPRVACFADILSIVSTLNGDS